MIFQRFWSMPSADTFDCEPIKGFVQKYLIKSKISIDPFARNSRLATHTNDLNPETLAHHHMEALDFLLMLKSQNVKADLVFLDPPYSLTQVFRAYNDIGLKFHGDENPTGGFPKVRDALSELLVDGGVCLSFGWNSVGLGKTRKMEIIEGLLVCHGGNRNDTICMAERKLPELQMQLV